MKLQLLTLVAIVTTVTTLPTSRATDLLEKRQVAQCTAQTLGQKCVIIEVYNN